MGGSDIATLSKLSTNIVALCDVDDVRAAGTFQAHPQAKRYKDFHEMLDKEDIDAVLVDTPDHSHARASIEAMKADMTADGYANLHGAFLRAERFAYADLPRPLQH